MNSATPSSVPNTGKRAAIRWTLVFLFLALMSVGMRRVTAQAAMVTMPEPTGPNAVGRAIYEWTDDARAERYSDDPEAKRELVVWVWYPANPAPEAQPDAYLPGMLGDIVEQQFGFSMNQIGTYAYADAPLAASDSAYPVLVFSHGNGALLGTYSALLEEIASYGYIVVGISHPYNTLLTVFSDQRVIPASQESLTNESVAYWVEDTAFVVDQLEALNSGDSQFAEKLDLSRLGIFGHSFGGSTAEDFCLVDARCQAGLNLDGTLSGEAGTQGTTQPFMQIFSEHPTCEAIVAAGGAPDLEQCQALAGAQQSSWQTLFDTAQTGYKVTIAGSMHNSFADNFFLLPLLPSMDEGATIDPERAWRVTADYVLAFFGKHLNGEDAPLLDAASPDYPEVTFEWHEQ